MNEKSSWELVCERQHVMDALRETRGAERKELMDELAALNARIRQKAEDEVPMSMGRRVR